MAHSYDHLAEWFECLNDDCDYPQWSQYFIEGLRRRNAGRRGFDLGCGSGAFTRALTRAGYDMTGGDISEAMLGKAVRLAREEGLSIPFVRTDAARLRIPHKVDFILSPNDCFNYLPPASLLSAFRHAARCLSAGGIFWFDVSSPHKLRDIVADNLFADDREEVTYLEFNTLYEDRVVSDITLFVKEGEFFRRFDESHTRYIHEEEAILRALHAAGFSVEEEGDLGGAFAESVRWNFICKKVSS